MRRTPTVQGCPGYWTPPPWSPATLKLGSFYIWIRTLWYSFSPPHSALILQVLVQILKPLREPPHLVQSQFSPLLCYCLLQAGIIGCTTSPNIVSLNHPVWFSMFYLCLRKVQVTSFCSFHKFPCTHAGNASGVICSWFRGLDINFKQT